MLYAVLKLLHVLSIVIWVGGMVFAGFFLRPAALQLPPPQRIPLMHAALQRFFAAVVVAVLVVFVTGGWMIGRAAKDSVQAGLPFNMPLDWTIMVVLGVLMMAIFGHIRFTLFRRLSRAVAAADWPVGGVALASIRTWVSVNLVLGLVIIATVMLMA
ncbi:CopD family protein [Hydrogenophaga sp. RWCD_12]|uniref:CopD family protein n=1 Tax=Hydrogenophaga sp. RWCD_12 TaxID=3391190 RepID=UPI00398505F5